MKIEALNVGDRVCVIDNKNADDVLFTDDVYEILKIDDEFIFSVDVKNLTTGDIQSGWFGDRFEKIKTPKPPSLPPEVKWMTLDSATIFAIAQAHIKDMYNITQEIRAITTECPHRGVLRISFKQEDKSVTS